MCHSAVPASYSTGRGSVIALHWIRDKQRAGSAGAGSRLVASPGILLERAQAAEDADFVVG